MPHIGVASYEWLESRLGGIESVRYRRWPGATCEVWEVVSAAGWHYLKRHPAERTYQQETHAYREWAPRLQGRAPEMVDARDDLRALIMTSAPGTVMTKRCWTHQERRRLHEEAGRIARRLHDTPAEPEDPLPLREALSLRLHFWSQRGESFLPPDILSWARAALAEHGPLFSGDDAARVPCHLDYQERNWIADDSSDPPRLMVIDFEHARTDCWLNDLVRLETGAWREEEGLKEAFLAGYGRELRPLDERRLAVLCMIWAIATIVWGRQRDDREFEELAWKAIERAQADL
jgi:hypothetical protein